jgi:16S rRNA (cytidine1402-2'-O)-methyltransferase
MSLPVINSAGQLWLIPVPIADPAISGFPPQWSETAQKCQIFIVEKGKTARRWLKELDPGFSQRGIRFLELNKHGATEGLKEALLETANGVHIALMSEAGCPGVADPGAEVIALAHQLNIIIKPLVGPNSLLLALMASGLNGQRFYFLGYLPAKQPDLKKEIRRWEQWSAREDTTIMFIETPYRNDAMLIQLLETLNENTKLSVAMNLDSQDEWIKSATVRDWKKTSYPSLHKFPCVFLFMAQ